MTDRDLMPFGKHKGMPMGEVPKSYLAWLIQQEGFADKNKTMAAYIRGEKTASTKTEREVVDLEAKVLADAPPAFKIWWGIAYGERLRKQGEMLYIPHLRVALEAWQHATSVQITQHNQQQRTAAGKLHQPTETQLLRAVLPPSKPAIVPPPKANVLDEDVPF